MTGVDSETTVPPHVTAGDLARKRCDTRKPTPHGSYTCTAEAGHDGPHAAYSSADHLCDTWPQALAGTGLTAPLPDAEPSPLAALAASYPVAQARADLAAYAEHMAVPVAGLDDAAQRAHKLRDAEVVGCVVGSLAGLLSAIDKAAGA